jgi:hypothetical protein
MNFEETVSHDEIEAIDILERFPEPLTEEDLKFLDEMSRQNSENVTISTM